MAPHPYARQSSTLKTPQNRPIPGSGQTQNEAGGYTWEVDEWAQLRRFLILGALGGTYYVKQPKLIDQNVDAVKKALAANGKRFIDTVVEVSDGGLAKSNDPALFCLALALKAEDEVTRALARLALPKVARIGTHLFHLIDMLHGTSKGWGRGTQKAFANWYKEMDPERLALQLVKYQQRDGWSHRDVLRLAKPKGHERAGIPHLLFEWVAKQGWNGDLGELPDTAPEDATRIIWAFEQAKRAATPIEVVRLINDHGLPREGIPTQFLNEVSVWEALLDNRGRGMPLGALIRNLPKMTTVGLLAPMSAASRTVIGRLLDEEQLQRARIHPVQVLLARLTYGQGRGMKGKLTWQPVQPVVDALDDSFYLAFKGLEPTGKRWMLGVDISASMGWGACIGSERLTPVQGAAVMAMVAARTERDYHIMGFAHEFRDLGITAKDSLDSACRKATDRNFGGTDCALPMKYARVHRIPVDMFVTYTDNQSWAGNAHASQELKMYRDQMGIDARMASVAMTAEIGSIADPRDPGMQDFVGFDANVPRLLASFAKGEV